MPGGQARHEGFPGLCHRHGDVRRLGCSYGEASARIGDVLEQDPSHQKELRCAEADLESRPPATDPQNAGIRGVDGCDYSHAAI